MSTATERHAAWRPSDSLANRILLVRTDLGLTQREASDKTGIPFGSWQGMEKGRQSRGLDVKVARVSLAFGVDRDWLMWGGPLDAKNPPPPEDPEEGDGGYAVGGSNPGPAGLELHRKRPRLTLIQEAA